MGLLCLFFGMRFGETSKEIDVKMAKKTSDNDTFADRLAQTLLRLYQNETFTKDSFIAEHRVAERTFFRDMNRLGSIIQKNDDGTYQLDPYYQSHLTIRDLEQFAAVTGIEGLFPKLDRSFLVALLQTMAQDHYLVKGTHYEDNKSHLPLFQQLEKAIEQQTICRMDYKNKSRTVQPYRLVNDKGIWYLAGVEDTELKAYNLSKISQLTQTDDAFMPDGSVTTQIDEEDSVWFSQDKQEVILKVPPEVAYYFERRKLFPGQELIRTLDDGGLIISCQMSHPNQVLPLIRYWIPKMDIISPSILKDKLTQELSEYLKTVAPAC